MITFVPAAASPVNTTSPKVPQPPSTLSDELSVNIEPGIFGLPI